MKMRYLKQNPHLAFTQSARIHACPTPSNTCVKRDYFFRVNVGSWVSLKVHVRLSTCACCVVEISTCRLLHRAKISAASGGVATGAVCEMQTFNPCLPCHNCLSVYVPTGEASTPSVYKHLGYLAVNLSKRTNSQRYLNCTMQSPTQGLRALWNLQKHWVLLEGSRTSEYKLRHTKATSATAAQVASSISQIYLKAD